MEIGCEPPRVVAGMPMYNEEETIGTVVTMALRHVDEVICIDDGSRSMYWNGGSYGQCYEINTRFRQ